MLDWDLEQLQQSLFADLLASQIPGGIFGGNEFVFFGIPKRVVDAIYNSDEAIGAGADDAIETVSEFRRLDFLRVFTADGGQVIGINEAGFQEIDVAIELDARRSERRSGNIRAIEHFPAELAVISHVVNGEYD